MTFVTAVPIPFTSFVYRTNVYWWVIHGIKRKPHLSVVWNLYHFVAIAILHQPRSTDSADINTRLQLSDTSSIPPMHGGFLLVLLEDLLRCWKINGITVGTPYNTNVGVKNIPDRAIWKPMVAKRNNTNPWSLLRPQILVTQDSSPTCPHPATGLSKLLPSCIHHTLPDNSLISVNL